MPIKADARDLVTDHVIIRWLERVEGYDFDDIRKEIKSKGATPDEQNILYFLASRYGLHKEHIAEKIVTGQVSQAIALGAKKVNIGEHTLIIKGGTVITMVPRRSDVIKGERRQRQDGAAPKDVRVTQTYYKGRKIIVRRPAAWPDKC